jgi:choline dehydrogenase-like flavoprotein
MTTRDFHTIIVGSGPGGSTVADDLTRAGRSVVISERGHNYLAYARTRSRAVAATGNGEQDDDPSQKCPQA